MSLNSLLQIYRNQGLRKQAGSAKALDEFLDILWVTQNLKIDPVTKSPSVTLKFYWWELASVIQGNSLHLTARHFPLYCTADIDQQIVGLSEGKACHPNLLPYSFFSEVVHKTMCDMDLQSLGLIEKSGKSQATNLLHTHQPVAAVLWHLKEAFGACDAPLGASLGTSVSHRDLAVMDVNKEKKVKTECGKT